MKRFVAAGTIAALFAGACSGGGASSGGSSKAHTVLYKIEGTASQADLTFATASGGTSQQSGVDVPVKRKSDGGEGIQLSVPSGGFLYISAQNPNDDGGSLTCIIEEDGVEIARNTSSGSFTIVTCNGNA